MRRVRMRQAKLCGFAFGATEIAIFQFLLARVHPFAFHIHSKLLIEMCGWVCLRRAKARPPEICTETQLIFG